jgi:hypothetical protein
MNPVVLMLLQDRLTPGSVYSGKTVNPSVLRWLGRALDVVDHIFGAFSVSACLVIRFAMAIFGPNR